MVWLLGKVYLPYFDGCSIYSAASGHMICCISFLLPVLDDFQLAALNSWEDMFKGHYRLKELSDLNLQG